MSINQDRVANSGSPSAPLSDRSTVTISDCDIRQVIVNRMGAIGKSFEIQVERGNVYLRGHVSSDFEARYLPRAIEQVAGVRTVRANLVTSTSRSLRSTRFDWSVLTWKVVTGVISTVALTFCGGVYWLNARDNTLPLISAEVSVRIENEPLAGAHLTLHPLQTLRDAAGNDYSGLRPIGFVRSNGHVSWTTFLPGDGIPAGQYVVTATWHRPISADGETTPGPNMLSSHFADPSLTPLRLIVRSDDPDQLLTIDLLQVKLAPAS